MSITPVPAWFMDALDALRRADVEAFLQMYAEDAVHEVPLARAGRPTRLQGRTEIAEYMRLLPALAQFDAFDDITAHEAGDELIIEAKAHGRRPHTQETFHMQYVWFITHDSGRVTRLRDYTIPIQ